jgi:hypothetical protein
LIIREFYPKLTLFNHTSASAGAMRMLACLLLLFGVAKAQVTTITSSTAGTSLQGPATITIAADVQSAASGDFLQVECPDNSWRKLQLGYDANSVWSNAQNITATGHTHMKLVLRGASTNVPWEDIGVRPQGTSNNVRLDAFIPTGANESDWMTLMIPVSQLSGLSNVSYLELPYSYGAGSFIIDIHEVSFVGNGADFVWFGPGKTDNARNGAALGQSPNGGEMASGVVQGSGGGTTVNYVEFLTNGQWIGTDTTAPFSFQWGPVMGNFDLQAVASLGGGRLDTSAVVSVSMSEPEESGDVVISNLADGLSFHEPTVQVELAIAENMDAQSYFRIECPDNSFRKWEVANNPNSRWSNALNVAGAGHTQMEMTVRAVSANVDWSKLGVQPQGMSNSVRLDQYIPAGADISNFTTLVIPMADFPSSAFNSVSYLAAPFSHAAGAFTIDIQKIEFTGGTQPLVWFGPGEMDRDHNGGSLGQTPSGGLMAAGDVQESNTIEKVDFFVEGQLVDTDNTAPYTGNISFQRAGSNTVT